MKNPNVYNFNTNRLISLLGPYIKESDSPYTLSSGIESHKYIDIKSAVLDNRISEELAYILSDLINDHLNIRGHYLVAPAYGGLLVAQALMSTFIDVHGTYGHLPSKDHGSRELLIGPQPIKENINVVLIDDVCTTGMSLLKTARYVQVNHPTWNIKHAISVVDRNLGAEQLFESNGIPYNAVLSDTAEGLKVRPLSPPLPD